VAESRSPQSTVDAIDDAASAKSQLPNAKL
jgi:hypothetical protein